MAPMAGMCVSKTRDSRQRGRVLTGSGNKGHGRDEELHVELSCCGGTDVELIMLLLMKKRRSSK